MANMTKDDEDVDVDNSPSPVSGCLSIKLDAADPKAKDRYSSPKANLCSGPLLIVKEPKYLADTYLPTDPQAGAKEKLRKQNFVQSNPICLCHKVYVSQYSSEEDKNFKPKQSKMVHLQSQAV